ncbi:MAG: hypothetical protein J5818_02200, partial [Eggerthellaceae bacterium]|nr:hypothetical protein [Eggerthellaceae bacterium]
EVLVTCVPSCDAMGRLQQDRVTVAASDLLLDDEELSIVHGNPGGPFSSMARRTTSCRVPALVWSQRQTAAREFLAQGFREEAPSDLLLALVCTAVLGSGSMSDLTTMGHVDCDLVAGLATSYPHLGFGDDFDTFEAPPFEVSDIASALHGVIDAFVKKSSCKTREEFASTLAAPLMSAGRFERACDVVRLICPRKSRIAWITGHAYRLVSGSCFLPLFRLATSMRPVGMTARQRAMLAVLESLCLYMLDDPEEACKCAKRYAFDETMPVDYRVIALVLLARCSTNTLKKRASDELATIAATVGDWSDSARSKAGLNAGHEAAASYGSLARAWCLTSIGARELFEYWEKASQGGMPDDMLCVVASWFYDAYANSLCDGEPNPNVLPPFDCSSIEHFVRNRIEAATSQVDFFTASAGLAMEAAHVRGMGYFEGPLSTPALIGLRNVEMSLLAQRGRFATETAQSAIKQDDWLATHPESALDPRRMPATAKARLSIPLLDIKTFGRLELSIGGQPIDEEYLKGAHVRPLIVLLAADPGREVPRDVICNTMWPNSSLEVARKSFYTVWSKLRRALVLPDGSCPYLIRHRVGCAFDGAHVHSDIVRLDEICRAFLFEEPDFARWTDLLIEIDRDYSGDLLPAETANSLVVRMREEYRTKLVDALVVASTGIVQAGNARRAAWCAQMAIDRDDTREDAYLALMRAQVASGQRAAAMATGRRGMHVQMEKLGIDPSAEMMEFYQQLLDADDL